MSFCKRLLVQGVLVGLAAATAQAQVMVDEKWDGYADGDKPRTPWQIKDVKENDPESVTVVGGAVLLDNVGTTDGNYNPGLVRWFEPAAVPLKISFTYRIPQDYGRDSQLIFRLTDTADKAAVDLILGRNYAHRGISYRSDKGDHVPVGHSFRPDETVTITLSNIDPETRTYDLAWSSSAGTSGEAKGIAFRTADVGPLCVLRFGESSKERSVSQLFLDDILVERTPRQ